MATMVTMTTLTALTTMMNHMDIDDNTDNDDNDDISDARDSFGIDDLASKCRGLSISSKESLSLLHEYTNNSPWKLVYMPIGSSAHGGGLYTCENIPTGTYLGDLEGIRGYSWEFEPSPYIFHVDDDMVINCTSKPRCLLAMMREGFHEGINTNCELIQMCLANDPSYVRVGFRTIRPVPCGAELVFNYNIQN